MHAQVGGRPGAGGLFTIKDFAAQRETVALLEVPSAAAAAKASVTPPYVVSASTLGMGQLVGLSPLAGQMGRMVQGGTARVAPAGHTVIS